MIPLVNASIARRALFALATSSAFERAVTGNRAGRAAAWRFSRRYVAGPTLEDALATAHDLAQQGLAASIDLFGERTSDPAHADLVADRYVELAHRLADAPPQTWLSLDLSHIALATDPAGATRRLERILAALPPEARLQIGAEEAALTDRVHDAICGARDPSRLSATLQANLRRSPGDADRLTAAGLSIRLVKGAYLEEEETLPYGEPTDLAYLTLAERLAGLGAETFIATHDGVLREACRRLLPRAPVEMLLGVRAELAGALAADCAVRIYVPYGPQWFRYGMRRFAEARGA